MSMPEQPSFHQEKSQATTQKSILVIDDSSDLLELQKTILEMDGFEVFTAQSGPQALKLLDEIEKPNLILLDVVMEEMSGLEFLSALEEKNPEIVDAVPIVLITGLQEVPQGRAAGFIAKPFDMKKYLQAIYRFLKLNPESSVRH